MTEVGEVGRVVVGADTTGAMVSTGATQGGVEEWVDASA